MSVTAVIVVNVVVPYSYTFFTRICAFFVMLLLTAECACSRGSAVYDEDEYVCVQKIG